VANSFISESGWKVKEGILIVYFVLDDAGCGWSVVVQIESPVLAAPRGGQLREVL